MRILQLTPGTGSFYCGSCIRDRALVVGLRRLGHEAIMAPLYLPPMLEQPDDAALDGNGHTPSATETSPAAPPVFFGGINVFLQEKSWLFRHSPRWIDRMLDAPGMLRRAARRAGMTRPDELGALTLSMLRGEEGRQAKELDKLMEWLRAQPRFDVVSLSNALLLGMAGRIRRELDLPVVCSLQGEDSFLDGLAEPYRAQCWQETANRAADAAAFIAISEYYGSLMRRRLDLPVERVHVAHNGIDLDGMGPRLRRSTDPPGPPTVGYLARLSPLKGLHTLVAAFILLKQSSRFPTLRLRVAGAQTAMDIPFVDEMRARLAQAGCAEQAEIRPNIDRKQKIEFLQSLSVFSVPATYGEAFGLYVLEALACGVPVVQPRHGAFPELLTATGGGILCQPDDPVSLAKALESLLTHPDQAQTLADQGRHAVRQRFSIEAMTQRVLRVYEVAMESVRRSSSKKAEVRRQK